MAGCLLLAGCAQARDQAGSHGDLALSRGGPERDFGILPGHKVDLSARDLATLPSDLALVDLSSAAPDQAATDLVMASDLACALNMPTSSCGIFPQCGCTATENCNINDPMSGRAACVAAGTIPEANGCNGQGDGQCARGFTCVGGVCRSFCASTSDCRGTSYRDCVQQLAGGGAVPGYKTCTTFCNPLDPTSQDNGFAGCGAGVNCIPTVDGKSYCFGLINDQGTQGVDCASTQSCAVGYECLNRRCVRFCENDDDCSEFATTCSEFPAPRYAGPRDRPHEIGYCDPAGSPFAKRRR